MPTTTNEQVIDARGLRCPWPVLRAAKALRECGSACSVVIVADDPVAPAELAAFATEQGLSMSLVETTIGAGFRLAPNRSGGQ